MRLWVLLLISLPAATAYSDPKEDFVKAVETQCKMPRDQAEKLATTGRTGTIAQYRICASPALELSDRCTVRCTKEGNNIGG